MLSNTPFAIILRARRLVHLPQGIQNHRVIFFSLFRGFWCLQIMCIRVTWFFLHIKVLLSHLLFVSFQAKLASICVLCKHGLGSSVLLNLELTLLRKVALLCWVVSVAVAVETLGRSKHCFSTIVVVLYVRTYVGCSTTLKYVESRVQNLLLFYWASKKVQLLYLLSIYLMLL